MTIILAILVLTLTLTAGLTISYAGQCNLNGLCEGSFLDATTVENKAACIDFCRTTPGCFWYSLHTDTGICFALEDCTTLDESRVNVTSGNKDCSKYSCNESGICHGTLIDGISTSDANSCLMCGSCHFDRASNDEFSVKF